MVGGAGVAERGFRLNFAGAKTNRRLFRAGASLPTAPDMSPARVGFNAPSSKNPAVIFAREPGKIQTKASTPRPADGGHGEGV